MKKFVEWYWTDTPQQVVAQFSLEDHVRERMLADGLNNHFRRSLINRIYQVVERDFSSAHILVLPNTMQITHQKTTFMSNTVFKMSGTVYESIQFREFEIYKTTSLHRAMMLEGSKVITRPIACTYKGIGRGVLVDDVLHVFVLD